jgi:hypothetical protein
VIGQTDVLLDGVGRLGDAAHSTVTCHDLGQNFTSHRL